MGRIFERRKVTMFARWDRMAKQFARASKEITITARKGSPDPASNPSLRRAVQNARALNMPKDRIEAAIRRASGHEAVDYQEILYEGYAPHGIAILVETATDNPTRTVANIRQHFQWGKGNMGASGSVAFQFKRMGVFRLDAAGIDADELELAMIDHGLVEMREGEGEKGEAQLVLHCGFADLGRLQRAVEECGIKPISAGHEYLRLNTVDLPEEQAKEVLALVDALEQDEDVQRVFHTLA
ncbi:MAG: YebC/PmpR family DNA-binding transcriptional regulator [Planctomycetaceae bacterium]